MKPFLRDILFTFLLCLSLIVVLEIAIGQTQTSHSYKDWYMTEHADKIKILLLGSSLFANSFDPHVFGDSIFDGASNSRRLWYDVHILKKFAPNMSNLKVVIIPLNACALDATPQTIKTFRYPYARYMGIPYGNNPLQYSALYSGLFTFRDLIPVKVFERVENYKYYNQDMNMDSLGYSPLYHVWNDVEKKDDGTSITTHENTPPIQSLYLNCIEDMAKYCNTNGIRLIFVIPPVADNIHSPNYNLLDSCLFELNKTFNFEYNLYHDDPSFRADSLYADELHLNHIGATLFAQRVKEDFNL